MFCWLIYHWQQFLWNCPQVNAQDLTSEKLTHLSLDKMAAILADENFTCIFLNENDRILIQISLKFVPKSPIDYKSALVQVMAWRRRGDKPLPESVLTQFTEGITWCQEAWLCQPYLVMLDLKAHTNLNAKHGPLTRYVNLRVAHAPGIPGTFFPSPWVSDPNMHHVPWCMPGSLSSGFLWSRWKGKRSQHSRCTPNPQFYVSGKRPMGPGWGRIIHWPQEMQM